MVSSLAQVYKILLKSLCSLFWMGTRSSPTVHLGTQKYYWLHGSSQETLPYSQDSRGQEREVTWPTDSLAIPRKVLFSKNHVGKHSSEALDSAEAANSVFIYFSVCFWNIFFLASYQPLSVGNWGSCNLSIEIHVSFFLIYAPEQCCFRVCGYWALDWLQV